MADIVHAERLLPRLLERPRPGDSEGEAGALSVGTVGVESQRRPAPGRRCADIPGAPENGLPPSARARQLMVAETTAREVGKVDLREARLHREGGKHVHIRGAHVRPDRHHSRPAARAGIPDVLTAPAKQPTMRSMGTERQYFRSPEDKARLASPHQIVQRRLSDDGQRWLVVERWLDTQVQPPKWRSRNSDYPLTKSELLYFAERNGDDAA